MPPHMLPELRADRQPPILLVAYKLILEPASEEGAEDANRPSVVGATPVRGPTLIHLVDGEWKFSKRFGAGHSPLSM